MLTRDDVPGCALRPRGPRGALRRRPRRPRATPACVDRAIGEHEVDTVFHLAAQTIVGTAQPLAAVDLGDERARHLTAAGGVPGAGVARVVVASSDKAYGAHDDLPYREDLALQPRFPYDVSKACTDLIARSYWHTLRRCRWRVTRFANVYGGGDLNPRG